MHAIIYCLIYSIFLNEVYTVIYKKDATAYLGYHGERCDFFKQY